MQEDKFISISEFIKNKKRTLYELHELFQYENNILEENDLRYKSEIFNLNHKLVGGDSLTWNYNLKIKFYKTRSKDTEVFTIHANNDKDNINLNNICLGIFIYKDSPVVNINIFNDGSCKSEDGSVALNGSILLKIALKFLESLKDKYKISRIVILDNSSKIFYNNKLKLPVLYSLLNGDTWYGKYHFKPYDIQKNMPDTDKLKIYKRNKEIISNATLNDMKKFLPNLIKLVEDKRITKDIFNDIVNIVNKNPKLKISEFVNYLIFSKEKYSDFLYYVYEDLYKFLDCYNFYNKYFYLDF